MMDIFKLILFILCIVCIDFKGLEFLIMYLDSFFWVSNINVDFIEGKCECLRVKFYMEIDFNRFIYNLRIMCCYIIYVLMLDRC